MSSNDSTSATHKPRLLETLVASTIGGSGYGALAALLSHPIDTIKTRRQVHPLNSGGTTATNANEITAAGSRIRDLYRGIAPAAAASVLFRAVPFTAYETVTTVLKRRTKTANGE